MASGWPLPKIYNVIVNELRCHSWEILLVRTLNRILTGIGKYGVKTVGRLMACDKVLRYSRNKGMRLNTHAKNGHYCVRAREVAPESKPTNTAPCHPDRFQNCLPIIWR